MPNGKKTKSSETISASTDYTPREETIRRHSVPRKRLNVNGNEMVATASG